MADKTVSIDILANDRASETFDKVGKAAESSSKRFDTVADRADNLDSKSAAATGSLGALSSGFELVGMENYAVGLQSAAMATDFFSGVGLGLKLVLESAALAKIKDIATTVAHKTAMAASAVATGAMTAAQWALNTAMSMNPIGLVVIAIIALVAVFVLAWKHSDTFRNIVTGAFSKVKDAASAAFGWVKSNWPLLLAIITGPIGLAVLAVVKNWDRIKAGAGAAKDFIVNKFTSLVGFIKGLPAKISSAASGMFNGIKDAFRNALNWVIGKWNGLSFSLPSVDIPGIGKIGGGTLSTPNITPLERGGIVRARPGGIIANIAEGGHDEAVIPLSGPHAPRGGSGSLDVRLYLDGRQIHQALIAYKRQLGEDLGLA